MQSLEVSGTVRPLEWSLGVKGLTGSYMNNVKNTTEGQNTILTAANSKVLLCDTIRGGSYP